MEFTHGRWAFAEFRESYQIESDFAAKVKASFEKVVESATGFSLMPK